MEQTDKRVAIVRKIATRIEQRKMHFNSIDMANLILSDIKSEIEGCLLSDEEILAWAKENGYYVWDLLSIKGMSISALAQLNAIKDKMK